MSALAFDEAFLDAIIESIRDGGRASVGVADREDMKRLYAALLLRGATRAEIMRVAFHRHVLTTSEKTR